MSRRTSIRGPGRRERPSDVPRSGPHLAALATLLLAPSLGAQDCSEAAEGSRVVRGFVQELQAARPVNGATVTARWSGGSTDTLSGEGGSFVLCGLRDDVPMVLQASVPPYEGTGIPVPAGGEPAAVMLTIDAEKDAVGMISGGILGRLLDRETLEPISNALVGVEPKGYTAVSDGSGRFLLEGLFPRDHTLRIRHLAYGEKTASVVVPQDRTLEVEVRLAPAVLEVEPIEVTVLGLRSRKLEVSGFYERREWNERLGHYLTRRDVERRGPARVSHLLSEIPRVDILQGVCNRPNCTIPIVTGSAPECRRIKEQGTELVIGASLYIDGHRTRTVVGRTYSYSLTGVDEFVMPGDVAGLEVYTGSGDLPGEFADANAQRCGAVVIWTGI